LDREAREAMMSTEELKEHMLGGCTGAVIDTLRVYRNRLGPRIATDRSC